MTQNDKQAHDDRLIAINRRLPALRNAIFGGVPLPPEVLSQIYYDINWLLEEADTLERIRQELTR